MKDEEWMEYMKKHNVSNIDITVATNGLDMYIVAKIGNDDSFEFQKELSNCFYNEILNEVHNHITIKDRRKKVIELKNKLK